MGCAKDGSLLILPPPQHIHTQLHKGKASLVHCDFSSLYLSMRRLLQRPSLSKGRASGASPPAPSPLQRGSAKPENEHATK